MPCNSVSDLPDSVKDSLPHHAQEIYKEAYNSAINEYGENEARCARIAWSAVKKKYQKNNAGEWVEK